MRPVAAGYISRATLGDLEREAVSNFRAGAEIVRRLGFSECRARYGSPPLAREWAGSWFEPPIVRGAQFISTAYFPWWSEVFPDQSVDYSDAD